MSQASGPAPEERVREQFERQGGSPAGRDISPAVGRRGEPGAWRRAVEGARVALFRERFEDARWSYLYRDDTAYRDRGGTDDERVAEAARRMRGGEELRSPVVGPVINPPVWTWQVPAYFWLGGMASGSSFVALAADLAGDERSARIARLVTVGAVLPGAPLLVLDLGRPGRFLNMLRIFKPRSAMSMGSWCLMGFTNVAVGAVAADALGREKLARGLGAATALFGTYLGSYTGVLLASTAVPLWARSRLFLGPVFVATGVATGAATNRLVLAAAGMPVGHPTRTALGAIETAAMAAELTLSTINERRLGVIAHALEEGRPGQIFTFAKRSVQVGLALSFARGRAGPWVHHVGSLLYILGGLGFRFAWIEAGQASARDHEAVARTARGKATVDDQGRPRRTARRATTARRRPSPAGTRLARAGWGEAVRRTSLLAEKALRLG